MIAQEAYVLNLLPREKSNFSTARISDMLPSDTSSKKLFEGPTWRLAIETTSRRLARMIWFLTDSASSWSRSISSRSEVRARLGSTLSRQLVGLELQVVHLAEQVHLLGPVEQWDLVQAGQVRGQPLGGLGPPGRLAVGRLGRRRHDLRGVRLVMEARVVNEFQLGAQDAPGPHLVKDAIDARARPAILSGQDLGGHAHAEPPVDLGLGVVVERRHGGWEDRPVGILVVVGLQRQSDGFC